MSKKVRDIMVTDVVTLGAHDTLDLLTDVMNLDRIRHFPVVADEHVVGVISQRDLFHASLSSVVRGYGQYQERIERINEMYLSTVVVKELMSQPPIIIGPEATIQEAARVMVEHKIGCLPVIERGKLLGLITETDILREAAAG